MIKKVLAKKENYGVEVTDFGGQYQETKPYVVGRSAQNLSPEAIKQLKMLAVNGKPYQTVDLVNGIYDNRFYGNLLLNDQPIGGGGTSDHALLQHLNYSQSGHTGFQPTLQSGTDIKYLSSGDSAGDTDEAILGSGVTTRLQKKLVSSTNIKSINNTSILGSGNVAVQATLVSGTNIKTVGGTSLLGSGDIPISGGSGMNFHIGTGTQTYTTPTTPANNEVFLCNFSSKNTSNAPTLNGLPLVFTTDNNQILATKIAPGELYTIRKNENTNYQILSGVLRGG